MNRVRFAWAFLWLAGAAVASATTYVAMADGDLVDQAAVVTRVKVVGVTPGPASGIPSTDYLVEVEEVAKGHLPGSTVVVRVPGGVRADGLGLKIWGAPEFQPGDEPLLFLDPAPDGSFRVHQLMLGAFHERRSGSAVLAVQHLSRAHRLGGTGDEPGVRDLERFQAWIWDRARGLRRAPDYWRTRPAGAVEDLEEKYAPFQAPDGLPVRWFAFDDGRSVAWKLDSAGQPGLEPAQVQDGLQAALQAWDDDPTSAIQYTFSGLASPGAGSGLRGTDGVNTVLFNDPGNVSVPGSYDCRSGGVLAMGGPYYRPDSTRSYRGQPYHEVIEADVVVQDGTECFFRNNPTGFAEVLAHELGHTLGFAHSADKNALMWPIAHNDGRGARLSDDDRLAASLTYGDGSFQPPPSPPGTAVLKLTATVSGNQVRLGWANAPSGTAEFRIERQESKNSFRLLQRLPGALSDTSLEGLAANKTYVLRVSAIGKDGMVTGVSNMVRVRTRK